MTDAPSPPFTKDRPPQTDAEWEAWWKYLDQHPHPDAVVDMELYDSLPDWMKKLTGEWGDIPVILWRDYRVRDESLMREYVARSVAGVIKKHAEENREASAKLLKAERDRRRMSILGILDRNK